MSEGSEHAAILIATSFQALDRAVRAGQSTLISDCTVLILFAGFYIEATLNHIFEHTGKRKEMEAFPRRNKDLRGKKYPGMQDKLAWFYNDFVARSKSSNWEELYNTGITTKLGRRFPGFSELHQFRNDISHGKINKSATSLETAQKLRQQAKDLAGQLYNISSKNGYNVPRLYTHKDATALLLRTRPRKVKNRIIQYQTKKVYSSLKR